MPKLYLIIALAACAAVPLDGIVAGQDLAVKGRLVSDKELAGVRTKLTGHWQCERTTPFKNGIRRLRIELVVTDKRINVAIFQDADDDTRKPYRDQVPIERIGFAGWSARNRNQNNKRVGDACYLIDVGDGSLFVDFVGDRMVVVGKLTNRPWEGFQFSGTYSRPAKGTKP